MAVQEPTREDAGRMTADLYREHGPAIFRYTLHRLGRREDAEDATQATFANAYSALSTGTKVREPRAWLFQIARHECLARVTDRRERAVPLEDEWEPADERPGVERQADTQRTVRDVLAAVAALPETQRDALVLREWSGLSTAEVAEALGTTVSSADALLHRARRSVLASVAGHDEAAGCRQTRDGLDSGRLNLAPRAHLVRCAECRSLRKQLLPAPAGGFTSVPPAILAERLGDLIPGFASSGGAAAIGAGAAASGGGIAAIIGKVAALPAAAKISVAIAGSAVVVGGTVEGARVLDVPKAPASPATLKVEEAAAAQSTPAAALAPAVTQPIGLTEWTDHQGGGSGSNSGAGGRGSDDDEVENAPRSEDHGGRGHSGLDDDDRADAADDDSSVQGSGDDGVREESAGSDRSGKGGGHDEADDDRDEPSGEGGREDKVDDDEQSGSSGKGSGDDQPDEQRDIEGDEPGGGDRVQAEDSSGKDGGDND